MAPKRVRRPAAAAPARHRPAARVEAAVPDKRLKDISLDELNRLGFIQLTNAGYYGREVQVAGEVQGMKLAEGHSYVDLRVTGTRDDVLLRTITGRPSRMIEVHICPDGCARELTGEYIVHGDKFTSHPRENEAWFLNVESVVPMREPPDELAGLREAVGLEGDGKGAQPEEAPKEDKKEKRKSKEKKESKEKRKSDKDQREEDEEEDREEDDIGKKDLAGLFGGTGLDPSPKKRRHFMKKARRVGKGKKKKKKKEETDSSGTSTSSSSSSGLAGSSGQGLFNSEKKVRVIARKFPGALAAGCLAEARTKCLTAQGTLWDESRKGLPPLFGYYCRQHVLNQMSPPMSQETLTVALCLDNLLQGKAAAAADILAQRLKALEALSRGSHWTMARQLELVRVDQTGITEEVESMEAARAAREEEKLKALTSRSPGGKGSESG